MRLVRRVAGALATAIVFLLALAGAILLHLDLPAPRRAVNDRLNRVFATVLPGRIIISALGRVGTGGVAGVDAMVVDPAGVKVLEVKGLRAKIATPLFLESLASGGDLRVDLTEVAADDVAVSLDLDEAGALRLARAFAKPPGLPSSGPPGRGVHLSIESASFTHLAVRGRPSAAIALDAGGKLDASFELPPSGPSDIVAHATWSGTFGPIAESADARFDAGALHATVDVPRATPDELRTFWPACPFTEAVRARVEVDGKLPELHVAVTGGAETSAVDATAVVLLGDELELDAHVDARDLDPRAFSADAPVALLTPSVDVAGRMTQDGALDVLARLDLPRGTVEAIPTPHARAALHMTRPAGAGAAVSGDGNVSLREPGPPLEVAVHLEPHGASSELTFDVRSGVMRLESVPELAALARGDLEVHGRGNLDLASGRVDGRVDATVGRLGMGAFALDRGTLSARASGTTRDLVVDADLQGTDFFAGLVRFDDVKAHAEGPLKAARVSVALHAPDTTLRGEATLSTGAGASLRDLEASLARGEHEARVRAKLVSVAGKTVRVDEAELVGLGAPVQVSLLASPTGVNVSAHGRAVELQRLARLAGAPPESLRGTVGFDLDGTVRRDSIDGHFELDVRELESGSVHQGALHVDTTLAGRKGRGRIAARLGDVGSIELSSTSLEMGPGSPLEGAAWRGAWGSADVTGKVDLAKLVAWLDPEIPLRNVAGVVDLKGHVARDSGEDMSPDVDVSATTRGLSVDGPESAPWQIRGVDASVRVRVDGQTAATGLDVQFTDARGPLVTLAASTSAAPYARLFHGEMTLAEAARTTPFDARADLPARDLTDLPAVLGTKGAHGDVAANVTWTGALEQPTVDAHATLGHGHVDPRLLALPVDLDLSAHYDGARATARLTATSREKQVLSADAAVDARAPQVLEGLGGGVVPWTGSIHVALFDFPLQSLAALDDRGVRGRASGTLALDGLHSDARASLDLSLGDLEVGEIACKSAVVRGSFDGQALAASMRVDAQDGWAQVDVRAGARWGAASAPTVDASQAVDASFAARQIRAALLLPFLPVFTELDGRVDADARVTLDPATKTLKPQGKVTLTGGVFELAAVGGEFHDATAILTFTPDGVVRLEKAQAKGLSGEIDAAASARISSQGLAGARGIIQVAKSAPLPLVVDGVQVGMFDGHVDVDVERAAAGKGYDVKIGVPNALVQLPVTSAHTVQTLGGLEGAHVGTRNAAGTFVPAPSAAGATSSAAAAPTPAATNVTVALGKDVEVKRGTDLDVHLDGAASFALGSDVRASGRLRLSRGQIEVQGKTFTLDSATVTFVDDPTNPQVVLTASWAAPDGTTVYADFVGPLKTGKVTLRSEPAHTQNEILSLILFGTTDQATASSTGGSPGASTAAGAAGGAATAPINRALGGVNQMLDNLGLAGGISTKIDTSQTTPRPEVEVQIARDVSIQVAWVLGVPPPGTNPDSTLFTLDWRFLRSWSLETTVGDAGTSILDLVWQHRY